MTAYTDDDVTADHGPLCANGVRCPDCGWPVPPEHDAAIAARALRQAADALPPVYAAWGGREWLLARAEQVSP